MPPTGDLEIQRALDLGWVYEASCRRREAAPTRPGQLVDVGTHHVGVYEAGEASPTVVFVHGAGDCAASWTHLQHQKALPGLSALQAAHRRSCCRTWRNQRSLDRLMSVVAIGWNASVTRSGSIGSSLLYGFAS